MAEWLRRLTCKPKVRTAVGSNPTLDSLVAVRNTSPGRPEPCERNLVPVAGSCGGLMVKHPWPLLEISLSDFSGLATLDINIYLKRKHSLNDYRFKATVNNVKFSLELISLIHSINCSFLCSLKSSLHLCNGRFSILKQKLFSHLDLISNLGA